MAILKFGETVYEVPMGSRRFSQVSRRKKVIHPIENLDNLFLQQHIKNRSTEIVVEIVELGDDYVIAYENDGTPHMISNRNLHMWSTMNHHRLYEPWFDYDNFGKLIKKNKTYNF